MLRIGQNPKTMHQPKVYNTRIFILYDCDQTIVTMNYAMYIFQFMLSIGQNPKTMLQYKLHYNFSIDFFFSMKSILHY